METSYLLARVEWVKIKLCRVHSDDYNSLKMESSENLEQPILL